MSEFRMPNEDRHKLAYDTFRGGLKDPSAIPHWDDAPSWVRDAMIVAYLQGKLDGCAVSKRDASPDLKVCRVCARWVEHQCTYATAPDCPLSNGERK